MKGQPRHPASALNQRDIPTEPGVYAWFHNDVAVYSGRAAGRSGLRGRIWSNHLRTGVDLSRSSFRRNVCAHLGIAPTATTKARPPALGMSAVSEVNEWIRNCGVAWIECDTPAQARALEQELHNEWMPPSVGDSGSALPPIAST